MMIIKDIFLKNAKSKIKDAKEMPNGIQIVNTEIICDYKEHDMILSSIAKKVSSQDDALDDAIKFLKASFNGRGTNYGWFGLSEDGKNIKFLKSVKMKDVTEDKIEFTLGNFLYIIDNLSDIVSDI